MYVVAIQYPVIFFICHLNTGGEDLLSGPASPRRNFFVGSNANLARLYLLKIGRNNRFAKRESKHYPSSMVTASRKKKA